MKRRFAQGLQDMSVVVAFTLVLFLLMSVSFSLLVQIPHVQADQASQTRYNTGYTDGLKNAECDFKQCQGHGFNQTVPNGHTNAYDNGYSKGYHEGWNKAAGRNDSGVNQSSSSKGDGGRNDTAKNQQIPNNNGGCDPTRQFCAMANVMR
jgi:hypothetical protein